MSYICKNCGHIISDNEYKGNIEAIKNKKSFGCFLWLVIILCFVSIILVPIAVILLIMNSKNEAEIICPCCKAKDSLIPDNTPIAKNLIKENYSPQEIQEIKAKEDLPDFKIKADNKTIWIILAIIIICYFLGAIILGSMN